MLSGILLSLHNIVYLERLLEDRKNRQKSDKIVKSRKKSGKIKMIKK
jgi:hypothetical protein